MKTWERLIKKTMLSTDRFRSSELNLNEYFFSSATKRRFLRSNDVRSTCKTSSASRACWERFKSSKSSMCRSSETTSTLWLRKSWKMKGGRAWPNQTGKCCAKSFYPWSVSQVQSHQIACKEWVRVGHRRVLREIPWASSSVTGEHRNH